MIACPEALLTASGPSVAWASFSCRRAIIVVTVITQGYLGSNETFFESLILCAQLAQLE